MILTVLKLLTLTLRFGFGDFRFSSRKTCRKIKKTFADGGPVFIKLGQFISSRYDIVGDELAEELASLCDDVKPYKANEIIKTIEHDLNAPLIKLFTYFDSIPSSSASIAQVHKATLGDKFVAVKVLKPGIKKKFGRSINLLLNFAKIASCLFPSLRSLKLVEIMTDFRATCSMELDLRFEAANASEIRKNLMMDQCVYVPKVYWERTEKHVVTYEWIDGYSIFDCSKDIQYLVAKSLLSSFFLQTFRDRFFHADLHRGNLLVDNEGRLVLIDFGIVGRVDARSALFIREIMLGLLTRDYEYVAKLHFYAGYVKENYDNFVTVCRAVGESSIGKSIGKISFVTLISQILKLSSDFKIQIQPKLLLLQKNLISIEGLCKTIAPELDIFNFLEKFFEKELKTISYRNIEKLMLTDFSINLQNRLSILDKVSKILDTRLQSSGQNSLSFGSTWILIFIIIFLLILLLR